MTREEAISRYIVPALKNTWNDKINNEVIEALEQEPKTEQFARWVAAEIFDENWEYNKNAFAEIACRKLAKLGIVIRMGDEWVLVEPQESEE